MMEPIFLHALRAKTVRACVCVSSACECERYTCTIAEAVVKKWKTKEKKTLPKFGLASWLEGTKCNSFNYQFCFLPSRAIRIVK